MSRLSIVITTYNVKELVLECIESCVNQRIDKPFEILVIDSGSTDGTYEAVQSRFPMAVRLMRIEENVGCAKARNIGMKEFADHEILMIDSDVVLNENALAELTRCVEPGVGLVGGQLHSVDESLQCTAFRKPTLLSLAGRMFGFERFLPLFLQERYSLAELERKSHPFWTTGAFTLITSEAVDKVGGRDTDFFIYGEEVEHAHRIKDAGLSVVFTPEAKALHYGSSSTLQNLSECREDVYRGVLLYWKKRQPILYPIALSLVVLRLTIVLICTYTFARKSRAEVVSSHADILGKIFRSELMSRGSH